MSFYLAYKFTVGLVNSKTVDNQLKTSRKKGRPKTSITGNNI